MFQQNHILVIFLVKVQLFLAANFQLMDLPLQEFRRNTLQLRIPIKLDDDTHVFFVFLYYLLSIVTNLDFQNSYIILLQLGIRLNIKSCILLGAQTNLVTQSFILAINKHNILLFSNIIKRRGKSITLSQ